MIKVKYVFKENTEKRTEATYIFYCSSKCELTYEIRGLIIFSLYDFRVMMHFIVLFIQLTMIVYSRQHKGLLFIYISYNFFYHKPHKFHIIIFILSTYL